MVTQKEGIPVITRVEAGQYYRCVHNNNTYGRTRENRRRHRRSVRTRETPFATRRRTLFPTDRAGSSARYTIFYLTENSDVRAARMCRAMCT